MRQKYDFRWEVLDVIISGRSSIDTGHGFSLESLDDASRFLSSYGYDPENPIERAEIQGIFQEALTFIRRYFLQPENPDGIKIEVPRKLLELTDSRELFLMANFRHPGQAQDTSGTLLRNWSCSILKVMHTIAHIDKDLRSQYFADTQKQIFDRYYRVIHRDSSGQLYLGEKDDDAMRVNLVAFETKPKKSRDSTILKLLHKPENVAEDIFDSVGIRFITPTRLGCLRVVQYLKDRMILMPPNIKPSRSRNTLIDLEDFRAQLGDWLGRAERGELPESELVAALETAAHPPMVNPDNPHSSEFYRALQFTVRQLIKLRNPLFDVFKELKTLSKATAAAQDSAAEMVRVLDRLELKQVQREYRFFYPYEVQIMDQQSAEENEKGRSAHSEYKRAQIQTALKRVMSSLSDVAK